MAYATRRRIGGIAILVLAFLACQTAWAQQNTILIIADDLSPDYLGCFSTTTDTAQTPTIRMLAQRGIRFTKVWAAPVCSPTRAGILTGRYPFRTGVGGAITSATTPQIDTAEMSIAKLLKYYAPTRYSTACIGKWHLNNNAPLKRLYPNRLGFDLYAGNFNGAIPDFYKYPVVRNGVTDTVTAYATTQTVDDALAWLDTISAAKPFFLWLAFNAPHDPFHVPPPSLCDTTGLSGTTADIAANPEKYFKAALQAMDTEIGRLLAYLSARGLSDSTNIIFIGDNGNQRQVAQIANPIKSKSTIYHYGVHVPMIAAGPAVVSGNRSSSELINTPDLFATIAELCGFQAWRSAIPAIPAGTAVDSRSFLPIIKNQASAGRTWIFSEVFNTPVTTDDGKTIRNEDYHLLRFDDGREELYNQSIDIEENDNLLSHTATLTAADISNYRFLCDSLSALTGVGTCRALAVTEIGERQPINLVPNPSSGRFVIRVAMGYTDAHVEFMTAFGQVISSFRTPPGDYTMDVSAHPAGLYYLLFRSNERIFSAKLIKY